MSANRPRSSTIEAYGAFAYAYDQALGEQFFTAVRRVLDQVLEKYPSDVQTHLDVACGTGLAIEHLKARGFQSIGVDAALPMLDLARRRAPLLVAADFRRLPFRSTFARITCLYDSLNHMQSREDLTAAFATVRSVMNERSLFLFDMNHPDVYHAVWGMREPYVSSGPDHHLEIATKYKAAERKGYARVTGWADLPNGKRVRIREAHEQRAWTERQICACLEAAGQAVVEIIDFDPFDEMDTVEAEGVKLFFVCRAR